MATLYQVPFEYPSDLPVTELRDLLNNHSVKLEYDFTEDIDVFNNHTVTGTLEDLTGFFQALDGPAQSFPIDEFQEWASNFVVS
jgi:hypothetical protein